MVFHGFSFGLVGLLAFKICTVDHHSENAILEGEDHCFGGSSGDRASTAVNSQSGSAFVDDQSVLVVKHKNCHC
jgi:hypothetical protein